MDLQIQRASPAQSEVLTDLAHAAKRHWGYPESWINYWKPDLTLTPDFIAAQEVFVATIEDEVVGCCALVVNGAIAELEHMWIKPGYIGHGVGRALFGHVQQRAQERHFAAFEITADPNAEGFYERMGAVRIGEMRSEIDGQPRVLPRMRAQV